MAANEQELASCCPVQFPVQPMCCDLDPTSPLLAVGLISGALHIHSFSYNPASAPRISTQQLLIASAAHAEGQSCRAVRFVPDTQGSPKIVSGGEDCNLLLTDAQSGKQVWQQTSAHDAAISMLRVVNPACTSSPICVSGDEDGGLKIWDLRARKQVLSYKKHTDYITDAALQSKEQAVVVTSGDGTLSIHDLRTNKFRARSEEDADDDLLSVAIVKGGKKVVAGTGSGVLAIWSWGYWNDCSDRYPGHPESVDAMVVWDDSTILTGSSDGLIRAVNIQPNKLLGVLGAHEELPVEQLVLSNDRFVLASTSHDDVVRLWDMSILHDDDDDDDDGSEDGEGEGEEGEGEEGMAAREGEDSEEEEEVEDDEDDRTVRATQHRQRVQAAVMQGKGAESESDSAGEWENDEGEGIGEGEGEGQQQGSSDTDEQENDACDDGDGDDDDGGGGAETTNTQAQNQNGSSGIQSRLKASGKQKRAPAQAAGRVKVEGSHEHVDAGLANRQAQQRGASAAAAAQDSDTSDGDSEDEDAGGRKRKKKQKRERTKWTRQKNQQSKDNFFSGLL